MLLLIWQVRVVAVFLNGEGSQADAVYKKVVPKLSCTSNMVGSTSISMYPLQRAAVGKGFLSKLSAAWHCNTIKQVAPTKGVLFNTHHRARHLDNPEMTTTLPGLSSHSAYACFNAHVAHARDSKKGTGRDDPRLAGTLTAFGMSRYGQPSKASFVWKASKQSRNTMVYCLLFCKVSQMGSSR